MRALVSGALGFVGRHMVRRLAEEKYEVDLVDRRSLLYPTDVRWFFEKDDVHYDLVVHCAAVVGGRTMIDGSPLLLAAEDLSIDADLFRWALRTRPKRIVYFSSSAAYPVLFQRGGAGMFSGPLHEDDIDIRAPDEPDQTYGWVKLTGERLAAEANAEGIKTHVFRPFSGYGEDQSLDYPFPSFIDRAVRRADPFDIWGDGTQVRDWIHIDDIVGGVMVAIEQDVLGPVNLGTGLGTSMIELAKTICFDDGYTNFRIQTHPDKPSGVQYRVADVTKMNEFYTAEITLEEGIARALSTRSTTPPPVPR
jgi:nucleoside-diphosphate-sugar epimerase